MSLFLCLSGSLSFSWSIFNKDPSNIIKYMEWNLSVQIELHFVSKKSYQNFSASLRFRTPK